MRRGRALLYIAAQSGLSMSGVIGHFRRRRAFEGDGANDVRRARGRRDGQQREQQQN